MSIFQKSVLKNVKQDEGLVALRYAKYPIHKKVSSVIPPARPSSPSERLIAFVTATITKSVMGIDSQPGNRKPSGIKMPRCLILNPPYKITINAAII